MTVCRVPYTDIAAGPHLRLLCAEEDGGDGLGYRSFRASSEGGSAGQRCKGASLHNTFVGFSGAQGRSRSPRASSASSRAPSSGKGSHEGKSKAKGKKGAGWRSVTPEGRQICFAYNSQWEKCPGNCNRAHCCQICFGSRPMHMHGSETKKAAAGADGGGAPPGAAPSA